MYTGWPTVPANRIASVRLAASLGRIELRLYESRYDAQRPLTSMKHRHRETALRSRLSTVCRPLRRGICEAQSGGPCRQRIAWRDSERALTGDPQGMTAEADNRHG